MLAHPAAQIARQAWAGTGCRTPLRAQALLLRLQALLGCLPAAP